VSTDPSAVDAVAPDLLGAEVRKAGPATAGQPPWARELAEQFFAGASCLFVLHGNVHDIVRQSDEREAASYGGVPDYLATQLFGGWDVVLRHDLSHGLRAFAGADGERLRKMIARLSEKIGEPKTWPRDPDAVLDLLDRLIQSNLMETDPAKRLSLAVVFDHAQYLAPSSDLAQLSGPLGSRLVRLLSWAQNPYIKRNNMAFCLLTDQLGEINERLVGSPHVTALAVPMPDADARREFAEWFDSRDGKLGNLTDFTPAQLAELTSGLNLVSLERLLILAERSHIKLDADALKKLKKGLIERQARGLVEFVEPPTTMDDFVGNEGVKRRLIEDAKLLARGRLDAAPMGYLICGPVGTGKTYLAECFAGSVGVPCVKLRNFRSKYVGETEGNLEQLLNVLRAMGPVVVVIDEADAALGTREGSRLLHDREPDGRHPLSRQAHLDAADQPPRPAADRPQASGPRRGPPAAVQPAQRRGSPRDVPRHGAQEQVSPRPGRPPRGAFGPRPERGRHRERRPLGQAARADGRTRAGHGRGRGDGPRRLRPLGAGA